MTIKGRKGKAQRAHKCKASLKASRENPSDSPNSTSQRLGYPHSLFGLPISTHSNLSRKKIEFLILKSFLGMMAPAWNPITQDVEAELQLVGSRPAWDTK